MEDLIYFLARIGPDFMQPTYTLGFKRCLDSVFPSVAAPTKFSKYQPDIRKKVQYVVILCSKNLITSKNLVSEKKLPYLQNKNI